jgi:hypothetical protein
VKIGVREANAAALFQPGAARKFAAEQGPPSVELCIPLKKRETRRPQKTGVIAFLRYARPVFRGEWMTMKRWPMVAAVICMAAAGCSRTDAEAPSNTRRPQQAGATSPLATAGHLAGIEAAGLTGDQRAMQGHVDAMHKDMMRSMHLPDPSRPINHEAARTAVRPLQGVQSSVWIDRSNLLVMVGGSQYRNMTTIDRICLALEPLGDTLGVVVNLQDVTATTSEGADTLSRNCQLRAGERAMLQQRRQVDVLDPEVRRVFRAQQSED